MSMQVVVLTVIFTCAADEHMPLVQFAQPSAGGSTQAITPEMQEALARLRKVHPGMEKDTLDSAVDDLFAEFAKHDPTVFVPLVVNDMIRLAPRDRRTVFVLRRSLQAGWIPPALGHGLLVQVGDSPEEHVQWLIRELQSPNTARRIEAIRALSICGAPAKDAIPYLEKIMRTSAARPEDYVRDYTLTAPMPEHVHAYNAIRAINKALESQEKESVLFEQDLHGERRAVLCARPCSYELHGLAPGSRRVTVAGLFLWLTIREESSGKMHHVWRDWITAESGVGPFALLEKDATTLAFAYVIRRDMNICFWEINTAQRVPVDPQSALKYAKSIAPAFDNTPTYIPVRQLLRSRPSDVIGHPQRLRILWKDNGWWVYLEANGMQFVFQRSQSDSKWRVVGEKGSSEEVVPKPQ